MRIKVLIVDDEKLERVLISKVFDWEKHGFDIIGDVSSAEEAMEYIGLKNPDIIFTDINMPMVDGLQFIENVLKEFPGKQHRFVIVTGYREFEYARKSIKLGVEDFLLKPINANDIEDTVLRIKEQIEHQRYADKEFCVFKETILDNEEIMIGSFKQSLVEDRIGQMQSNRVNNKKSKQIVDLAVLKIHENLFDPNLCLSFIANKIYANDSYLSRIFKQEVGESLISYITRLRIEESIRLLNTTDLRVYEIADKVGIKDPHYFSICFKKQVGITIKDFKKRIELRGIQYEKY